MPNPVIPAVLTQAARDQLIGFAKEQFGRALQANYDAVVDFPGFVADTGFTPPNLTLPKALTRQACRRWARGDALVRGPGFDAAWSGVCEPYLDSLGESPSTGSLAPPFEGGQCSGTFYRAIGKVTYTLLDCGFTPFPGIEQPIATEFILQGPVTSIQAVSTTPGNCGNTAFFVRAQTATGPVDFGSFQSPGPNRVYLNPVWSGTLEPAPGSPNNCGNPPPLYLPPGTPTGLPPLPPVTVDVPGIGPVDVDVSFDDDGNIIVSLPDLGIELEVPNPFAGGDDGGGGPPPEIGPPGFQGNPGESQDVDGEPAEGEDEDRYLVGVLVETIDIPPRVKTNFNAQNVYYSGLYYVYMGGDQALEQSNAAIVKPSQFFYAPEAANRFRVEPNNNVAVRVTPFWRDIET